MPWSSLILTCFISCQLQKIINTRLRSEDTDVVAAKYFDLCAVTGDMTLTDAGIAFVFRLKQTPPWERGSTIWQSMTRVFNHLLPSATPHGEHEWLFDLKDEFSLGESRELCTDRSHRSNGRVSACRSCQRAMGRILTCPICVKHGLKCRDMTQPELRVHFNCFGAKKHHICTKCEECCVEQDIWESSESEMCLKCHEECTYGKGSDLYALFQGCLKEDSERPHGQRIHGSITDYYRTTSTGFQRITSSGYEYSVVLDLYNYLSKHFCEAHVSALKYNLARQRESVSDGLLVVSDPLTLWDNNSLSWIYQNQGLTAEMLAIHSKLSLQDCHAIIKTHTDLMNELTKSGMTTLRIKSRYSDREAFGKIQANLRLWCYRGIPKWLHVLEKILELALDLAYFNVLRTNAASHTPVPVSHTLPPTVKGADEVRIRSKLLLGDHFHMANIINSTLKSMTDKIQIGFGPELSVPLFIGEASDDYYKAFRTESDTDLQTTRSFGGEAAGPIGKFNQITGVTNELGCV